MRRIHSSGDGEPSLRCAIDLMGGGKSLSDPTKRTTAVSSPVATKLQCLRRPREPGSNTTRVIEIKGARPGGLAASGSSTRRTISRAPPEPKQFFACQRPEVGEKCLPISDGRCRKVIRKGDRSG